MRISDWSSDVCSSDLPPQALARILRRRVAAPCTIVSIGQQARKVDRRFERTANRFRRIHEDRRDAGAIGKFRNEAGTDDRAATERNQLGDLVTRFLGGRVRALLDLQAELLLEFGERGQSAAVTEDRKSTRLNSSH